MKCEICGGASRCPDGLYSMIEPIRDGDYVFVPEGRAAPSEYHQTHRVRGGGYFLHPDCVTVGAAQRHRIRAHHPDADLRWVGQCTYAFRAVYS